MKKLIGSTFALAFSFSASANDLAAIVNIKTSIMGYNLSPKGLTLQVSSSGCTGKDNFKVAIAESYPAQITITQTGQDICDAYLPFGTEVTFSFAELSVKPEQSLTITPPKQTDFRVPQGF